MTRPYILIISYASLLLIALAAWHTERLYVGGLAVLPLLFIAYHCSRLVALTTAIIAGVLLAMLDRDMLPGAGRVFMPPVFDAVILSATLCATVLIARTLRRSSAQNILLRESLHRAQREAERDALTGIPNRRYFLRLLTDTIASAGNRPIAVLFADLDGFKQVNDTAGHAIGDAVLELAAERLRRALRSGDVIARIGGDEFAILIDRLEDYGEAPAIAAQIEHVIAHPFSVGDRRFTLGITLGASFYPRDATDAKTLLRLSDARMYREKAAKRRSGRAVPRTSDPERTSR